jgi:Fur family ferric uptake transcriptional regulator
MCLVSDLLKSNGLKNTKSRRAVLGVFGRAQKPLTAEEIYARTAKETPMSLSTTYRTLSVLNKKGVLLKNPSQDGKTYFQINNQQHKHQLICTVCHRVIPVAECPLAELESLLSRQTGYIITGHNLEFSGICPECAANEKKNL